MTSRAFNSMPAGQGAAMLCWLCAVLLLVGQAAFAADADSLPEPQGKVVLTISGALQQRNRGNEAQFDLAMLQAMKQYDIVTVTPWTEGLHRYRGVRLSELLARVGAKGDWAIAYGLDDFHARVDLSLASQHGAIIALFADGHALTVRSKGPLWLIFPLSDAPQLDTPAVANQMVWQLNHLQLEP
ncbi:molybdopterin-dependent oxidoreductase [Pokkaliibacter sp. MBI-7]|uniref:molybdopterin-dependent oxidoreductase n=1 Tax=Pokkaliibacter sp. MBI-7 TaxID=3040600 RepID=UPI00244B77D4|nr:molybdopterin-dependent oxidoreductase [Pokkaliibacter sp. MBI-7]MDH2433764.1 molybdopterin-dependent oxidoreductase [Pokkaliibacter sp. MBI-7]